jgi:hypothetical protein
MISLTDYWMGRDAKYPEEFTDVIQFNGQHTVNVVNGLLADFARDTGIVLGIASGWRPLEVNDVTANSGRSSKHISAQAADIRDTPKRDLARWVANNIEKLAAAGLYCERFEWTPTWVHFSPLAPKSGKRFYIPNANVPIAKRMPEQDTFNC